MPLTVKAARCVLAAVVTVTAFMLIGQIPKFDIISSSILAPGAWVYLRVFGAGHDMTTVVGMLTADVLFFTSVYLGAILIKDAIVRRK